MLLNESMLDGSNMLGAIEPIDAGMLSGAPMALPPVGDNYNQIRNLPTYGINPSAPPMVNGQVQEPMPQQPLTGIQKFQGVIDALRPLSEMIDDENVRSVLPAEQYLKYKKEKEDQKQNRQNQLLDSMKLEADLKFRREQLDIQREENQIRREALLRADAPSKTALMQNYEFIQGLMPNANPVDLLPFATGAGAAKGVDYDPVTGEVKTLEKPLPSSALNIQNTAVADVATAEGTQQSLDKFIGQIDKGELDLGLVSNIYNKTLNNIGLSSTESRNLQSFQSSLEKLRNDSLRLNAGVQTDGDAQRAWSELVANINDPAVVKQRLQEIKLINERGAALKKLQVDSMRQEYGKEGYDWSQTQALPSLNQPTGLDADKMKRLEELRAKKARGELK